MSNYSAYGLTTEHFTTILEAQGYMCPICARPFTADNPPYVDHCHISGDVRGLVCNPCNGGMGMLRDNPTLLRAAAEYLENYRERMPVAPAKLRFDAVTTPLPEGHRLSRILQYAHQLNKPYRLK